MRSALVVDDNQDLAQAIAAGLESEGFQVRTANNGLHGCAYYFREPTDLVVTDIQISELDGVEMMRCIRAVNPKVRAVYLNAATTQYQAVLDREQKEFAATVIEKPFSIAELLRQIGL